MRDLGESDRDLRFDEGREVELEGIAGKRRIFRVQWEEGEDSQWPSEGSVFRREGDYWTVTHQPVSAVAIARLGQPPSEHAAT